jgi:hypothetical protein
MQALVKPNCAYLTQTTGFFVHRVESLKRDPERNRAGGNQVGVFVEKKLDAANFTLFHESVRIFQAPRVG